MGIFLHRNSKAKVVYPPPTLAGEVATWWAETLTEEHGYPIENWTDISGTKVLTQVDPLKQPTMNVNFRGRRSVDFSTGNSLGIAEGLSAATSGVVHCVMSVGAESSTLVQFGPDGESIALIYNASTSKMELHYTETIEGVNNVISSHTLAPDTPVIISIGSYGSSYFCKVFNLQTRNVVIGANDGLWLDSLPAFSEFKVGEFVGKIAYLTINESTWSPSSLYRWAIAVYGIDIPFSGEFSTNNLRLNPVFTWRFSTPDSYSLDDTGQNRVLSYFNSPTTDPYGLDPISAWNAKTFNGVNQYGTRTYSSYLNVTSFTVDAFFRMEALHATESVAIIERWGATASTAYWGLFVSAAGHLLGNWQTVTRTVASVGALNSVAGTIVPGNTYYVTFTYDPLVGATLYVNGFQVAFSNSSLGNANTLSTGSIPINVARHATPGRYTAITLSGISFHGKALPAHWAYAQAHSLGLHHV